jgi:hypothetical protein
VLGSVGTEGGTRRTLPAPGRGRQASNIRLPRLAGGPRHPPTALPRLSPTGTSRNSRAGRYRECRGLGFPDPRRGRWVDASARFTRRHGCRPSPTPPPGGHSWKE